MYVERETGEILEYNGLIDINGYKKYESLDKSKVVRRHICEELNEKFKDNRLLKRRKRIISF